MYRIIFDMFCYTTSQITYNMDSISTWLINKPSTSMTLHEDYDRWAQEFGADGWSWKEALRLAARANPPRFEQNGVASHQKTNKDQHNG